jgi:hypothetical protein
LLFTFDATIETGNVSDFVKLSGREARTIRMGDDFEPRDPSEGKTGDAKIEAVFFKNVP